jgi:hypothetical protein
MESVMSDFDFAINEFFAADEMDAWQENALFNKQAESYFMMDKESGWQENSKAKKAKDFLVHTAAGEAVVRTAEHLYNKVKSMEMPKARTKESVYNNLPRGPKL